MEANGGDIVNAFPVIGEHNLYWKYMPKKTYVLSVNPGFQHSKRKSVVDRRIWPKLQHIIVKINDICQFAFYIVYRAEVAMR